MTRADPPPTLTTQVPGLPPRPETMHKGQAGCLAIIAGSRGMSGAAILAGLGALRGGAGLVRVLTPASAQPIVAAAEPCLMTVPLPEDTQGQLETAATRGILESLKWADVAAIGPGLGQSGKITGVVSTTLAKFAGPVVVDADGLNTISSISAWWKPRAGKATIITPHPGEMARLRQGAKLSELRGEDDGTRLRMAHEFTCLTGVTVVLKGHRTIVCTPEHAYVNTTGNAGMATGGMGDVLTGLIAALLAQGLSAFDAACLGVHCHGWAADQCAMQIAPVGYLAHEVAEHLPAALVAASQPAMGFKP